ncbi:DUF655 domain-containing protein [Methanococcus voltae]|uniref:Nucleotide binding protein n=2 Tax=Methanococcus voltae TaxID=2188 RepID=A0ABT2EXH9_METVO|nr:DUF655 domain-containing protein [Methanococcus voltae]MBP2172746.1 putative nucleotide binding protein [Methanococcus voltae]MBP2201844.1 putative nucleotide binding protein [Methanococcus voltae]MCS3922668.1 putative nucleotide binding protein [Methanococcus voltae PS]
MQKTRKNYRREFEDYAYVLDFLPYGRCEDTRPDYKKKGLVQAFGEKNFVLMELELKDDVDIDLAEKLYIGKHNREKVSHVLKMIKYEELSRTSKLELVHVIKESIFNQENRFIDFLNTCDAISPRLHSLQILPSVGKTAMWKILEEREKKPFENFADFEKRVHKHNIVDVVAQRIEEELKETQKHYLFIKWKNNTSKK